MKGSYQKGPPGHPGKEGRGREGRARGHMGEEERDRDGKNEALILGDRQGSQRQSSSVSRREVGWCGKGKSRAEHSRQRNSPETSGESSCRGAAGGLRV